MATHDYNIANSSGINVRSDLNAVLAAIMSQNSSATEPTTTVAGMFWYDTSNSLLKQRNNTNDAWLVKWDTTKGQLATLASPTFTGLVNLPSTTYIGGSTLAITTSPTFTGTATFANLTVSGSVSLPASTAIGGVSATEIGYLDGVTSSIQSQLNTKQASLVSGTNIKTVNGFNILGSGDVTIPSDTLSSIFANSQEFTSSGTFTVPAGVTKLLFIGTHAGAGGGGGGAAYDTGKAGGAGGGGAASVLGLSLLASVTQGQEIPIVIGAGGSGGAGATSTTATGATGGNGGNSSALGFKWNGSNSPGAGGIGTSTNVNNAGGGGGGGTLLGSGGTAGNITTAGGTAVPNIVYTPTTNATGGAVGGNTGGTGGTSELWSNGNNGNARNTYKGGAGGAGGAGTVIVYW